MGASEAALNNESLGCQWIYIEKYVEIILSFPLISIWMWKTRQNKYVVKFYVLYSINIYVIWLFGK